MSLPEMGGLVGKRTDVVVQCEAWREFQKGQILGGLGTVRGISSARAAMCDGIEASGRNSFFVAIELEIS